LCRVNSKYTEELAKSRRMINEPRVPGENWGRGKNGSRLVPGGGKKRRLKGTRSTGLAGKLQNIDSDAPERKRIRDF